MLDAIKDYNDLFIHNTPLLDVRAPIEYQKGAFPNAANLPIMDDDERKIIGICYKNHGQQTAIKKGHQLVHGAIRETRIRKWIDFAKQNPNGSLYCFRGGLRSKITQQWLHKAGVDFPVVQGGYKALRSHLLQALENAALQCSFKLIGGKTGCGKTILVKQLKNGIDLEAAAYHRGSSFGRHATAQNNQINFENILAIDFIKYRYQQPKLKNKIVLEDESRNIGFVGIPKTLFIKMRNSPLVVIEEPIGARIERLTQEYVVDMHQEFIDSTNDSTTAFDNFSYYLLNSLEKVQKRLGPARYGGIKQTMQQALTLQAKTGEINKHYDWLSAILANYYDPMYEDQLKQRKEFICFRGNFDECKEFLGSSDLL